MTGAGKIIEIQATAEKGSFEDASFNKMLALAREGITDLVHKQRQALNIKL